MCDYSLFQFPNRLARDGEYLTTHRFSSGCVGLITATDPSQTRLGEERGRSGFRDWLLPNSRKAGPTAVCVAPGTQMRCHDWPQSLKDRYGLSASEEPIFIQRHADTFSYRDALLFGNGQQVSLQNLPPGLKLGVGATCRISEVEMKELQNV